MQTIHVFWLFTNHDQWWAELTEKLALITANPLEQLAEVHDNQ